VDVAKKFMGQISGALGHCHHKNIIHRDMKPENILVNVENPDDMYVKVVDFGLSVGVRRKSELLVTQCGSMPFASPQIMKQEPYNGFAADIWASGVVLMEMMCGVNAFIRIFHWREIPHVLNCGAYAEKICEFFSVSNAEKARERMRRDFLYEYAKADARGCDKFLDLLLGQMLVVVSEDRCTIKQIGVAPWLEKFIVAFDAPMIPAQKELYRMAVKFDHRGPGLPPLKEAVGDSPSDPSIDDSNSHTSECTYSEPGKFSPELLSC